MSFFLFLSLDHQFITRCPVAVRNALMSCKRMKDINANGYVTDYFFRQINFDV